MIVAIRSSAFASMNQNLFASAGLMTPISVPLGPIAATAAWVGGINGYLRVRTTTSDGCTEKRYASLQQVRTLLTRSRNNRELHRAAAIYALVIAAATVSPYGQSSQLIAQMVVANEMVEETCCDAEVRVACNQLLMLAIRQRGIGVRSLHRRLLAEAEASTNAESRSPHLHLSKFPAAASVGIAHQ
jgi:hypothetical protein